MQVSRSISKSNSNIRLVQNTAAVPPPPPPPLPGSEGSIRIPTYKEQREREQHQQELSANCDVMDSMREQQVNNLSESDTVVLIIMFPNLVFRAPLQRTKNNGYEFGQQYANLPSKLSSCMNKDKKPFTYTIGGAGSVPTSFLSVFFSFVAH